MTKIKLIVDGGAMKPGPTVAQQLGPMGINLGKVIEDVNKATEGFKGMKVPVEIDVDPKTKNYEIFVSSPPMTELIKKELAIEKGSGASGTIWAGNISIERLIGIAKTKMPNLPVRDLKGAVMLAIGSCVSAGILIDSKNPKDVADEVRQGIYDAEISNEKTEPTPEKEKELQDYFKEIQAKQAQQKQTSEESKA